MDDVSSIEHDNLLNDFAKYPKLKELHYLKEEFNTFFTLTTKEDAVSFLDYYEGLVAECDIPDLEKFVKTLDNWMEYILNYYDYPISNGTTEGNNHKVKNDIVIVVTGKLGLNTNLNVLKLNFQVSKVYRESLDS